jgi:hypothetical protein
LIAALTIAHTRAAAELTPEQRTARCANIRDVAADNGIASGYLLAGIASAETNLSHCWSELTWACQGPDSPDCGGPVVAGAGDGPCSLQQGGLGMFQFDGGTFGETIERDGDGVLLVSGNVTRAIDFVVNMVMNSQYVEASTPEEAKAWLNQVTVDGEHWDAWVRTVTHYYNGCSPSSCSAYAERYAHYDANGRDVYDEQGVAFWDVELGACAPIGDEPRVLEETDPCFTKGGPLPYWRVGMGGESNLHIWTGAIDAIEPVNFAEWTIEVAQTGEYLVEISAYGGTATEVTYLVDHAGVAEEVTIDPTLAEGFIPLGAFVFTAEHAQRILLGDNTGAPGDKIVADAIRVTRLDVPGPGHAAAGAGGGTGDGGEGGGRDADGGDDGCSVAAPAPPARLGGLAALLALGLVPAARRSRRR